MPDRRARAAMRKRPITRESRRADGSERPKCHAHAENGRFQLSPSCARNEPAHEDETPRASDGSSRTGRGKPVGTVILRSPALRDDEESRIAVTTRRARSFAQFTLSEMTKILLPQGGTPRVRFQDSDGVHRTPAIGDGSEGLRMTAWKSFSAACKRPRFATMY
jgi:hypothetical protein